MTKNSPPRQLKLVPLLLGGLTLGLAAQAPSQLAFAAAQADLAAGQKLATITVKLEDGSGNVVASGDTVRLTLQGGDAAAFSQSAAAVNGVAQVDMSTAPLPLAGNYILTASDTTTPAVPPVSESFVLQAAAVAVGQTASGASRQVATFVFNSAFTVSAIAELTQGTPNLYFTADAGTDATACATGTLYSAGQSCTVGVDFAPAAPGVFLGAVQLSPSSGAPLTVLLARNGTGPLANYNLPTPVSAAVVGAPSPGQIAVDSAGNIFIPEPSQNAVKEFKLATGTTQPVAGTFNAPSGVAVDGAGDVFVADSGSHNVLEITGQGTSIVLSLGGTTPGPLGVALDGNGALYVADTGNGKLWKLPRGCLQASCGSVLASGLGQVSSVAVDTGGNVFYSVIGNSQIQELPGGAGPAVGIATGLSQPAGLAVGAGGNLYAADSVGGSVAEISGAVVTTLDAGLVAAGVGPQGVALDGDGNIYVANAAGNSVLRLRRYFFPPSVSILLGPATAVYGSTSGSISIALQNSGNAGLNLSALQAQNNEVQKLTGTNDCTATTQLAAGGSCALAVVLTAALPGSSNVGNASGLITVSNNSLNNSGAQQQLILNGTITPAVLTVSANNKSMQYGAAALPAFTDTITGFVNSDPSTVVNGGPPSLTSSAVAFAPGSPGSPVGSYAIMAAQGSTALTATNYTFQFVNGTLNVTPAPPLTFTVSNATRAFGVANPTFTGAFSGFVNGDTAATAITGAPVITTAATAASDPGTFALTPALGSLSANNYTSIQLVAGTLTVTQATQTITFGALANHLSTDPPFTISATASSGLPVSFTVVSGPATITGSTVTLNGSGNVDLEAFQVGNPDYQAAAGVHQTFTVVPQMTFSSSSLNFGALGLGQAGKTVAVTLSNNSGANIAFSVSVTGKDASSFTANSSTCGTSLPNAAACVEVVTFTPQSVGTFSAALLINEGTAQQSLPLSGQGSNFTLVAASVNPITAGQSATVNLSLASTAGDNQTVALSCSVNGVGTGCTVNTPSVTLTGTTPSAATLTVTTSPQTALAPLGLGGGGWWWACSLVLGLMLVAVTMSETARRRWKVGLVAGAMAMSMACGGSAASNTPPPPPPPPGPATITVTVTAASSTNEVHTATTNIVVNP